MKTTKRTSNREKALNTAEHLFLTKGFLFTSMDEIVAESKVSKTNIVQEGSIRKKTEADRVGEELLEALMRRG